MIHRGLFQPLPFYDSVKGLVAVLSQAEIGHRVLLTPSLPLWWNSALLEERHPTRSQVFSHHSFQLGIVTE